jgi:hypothetical protein
MTESSIDRVDVSFKTQQDAEGALAIRLLLTREGKPLTGSRVFTLQLAPNLTEQEAETLVEALNRCITHLGMGSPEEPLQEGGGS